MPRDIQVTANKPKPDRSGERQKTAANKARRLACAAVVPPPEAHLDTVAVELGASIGDAIATKPSRAGERARQLKRREEKADEARAEEALKRQRTIASVETAVTPAQQAMARLKARIAAKNAK